MAECLERDTWSDSRWRSWTEERLCSTLRHAAANVPYYRAHWEERWRRGDRSDLEDLGAWPILTKDELRRNPEAFLADGVGPLYAERTSGTTGTPLTVWVDRASMRFWFALCEARIRRWSGVSLDDRWAILGGQMVVPTSQSGPPFWVHNWALHQLYLSGNHVAPHAAAAMAAELRRFRPTHVVAYPSSITLLAEFAALAGADLGGPQVVVGNAEAVTDAQRQTIQGAFGCPIRQTYGMGEMVAGASECSEGRMHWWPEVGQLEVLGGDGAEAAARGQAGRLVLTGLINRAMPLVRYEVGDRGLPLLPSGCRCGRSLPELEDLEGRVQDTLVSADGRRVFWVNPIFYGLPVVEAQLRQTEDLSLSVVLVPGSGYDSSTQTEIADRLKARVGDLPVSVHRVTRVPREPSGKLRPVVSAAHPR